MDAESNLVEKITVPPNNGSTSGEPADTVALKEKAAEELKSAASLKGGGDGLPTADAVPPTQEKDDLLERLEKIDTSPGEAKESAASTTGNDVDMENDDLIQRLEAMEKGDEAVASADGASSCTEEKKSEKSETEVSHQNGLEEKSSEAESAPVKDNKPDENKEEQMEVDAAEKKDDVSSSDSVKPEATENGASGHEPEEQPSSSAKRRHSEDQDIEPSSKKVHVEDGKQNTEEVDSVPEKQVENAVEEKPQKADEPVEENEDRSKDSAETLEAAPEPAEKKDDAPIEPAEALKESETAVEEIKPKTEDIPSEEVKHKEEDKPSEEVKPKEEDKPSEEAAPPPEPAPDKPTEIVDEPTGEVNAKKEENPAVEKPIEEAAVGVITDEKKETTTVEEPVAVADAEKTRVEKKEATAVEEDSTPEEKMETNPEVSVEKNEIEKPEVIEKQSEKDAPAETQKKSADASGKTEGSTTAGSDKSAITTDEVKSVDEPAAPEPVIVDASKPIVEEEAKPEPSSDELKPAVEAESKDLPDTEPNTESDTAEEQQPTSSSPDVQSKSDEGISSSSEQNEPVQASSTESVEKPTELETVTSSDEKPDVEPVTATSEVVDSTPEKADPPAVESVQADEPMEVDSEPVAVQEVSNAEVSEAPCTKKEAFQCTDDSNNEKEADPEKNNEVLPEVAPVAVEPTAPAEKPKKEEEQMEVDSASVPTQSKQEAETPETTNVKNDESTTKDNDTAASVADSQSETATELNRNVDAASVPEVVDESKADASKTLDDSIECSLPTSSSDKLADRLKQRLDLISNGSSTPNTAVSSSNVYNSTPIQKQFEISSEDVSKIARHSVDNSHQEDEEHSVIAADNSAVASTSGVSTRDCDSKKDVPETTKNSSEVVKDESSLKTTESSEVDSCTASSALNTADEINMYATNARKFNGISSTSGSELEDKSLVGPTSVSTTATPTTVAEATTSPTTNKFDLTPALTSEDAIYEVSVWFDGADLQFLSVEKVDHKLSSTSVAGGSTNDLTAIDSSKQSSNGSVASLGPFPLPPARPVADSGMSQSSTTESTSGTSQQLKTSLPKIKHTVRGAKALATLMVEEFEKIKKALSKDEEVESESEQDKSKSAKTPKTAKKVTGRGQKRSHAESDAEEEQKAKGSKGAKKQKSETPVPPESDSAANQDDWLCCLARWSDRKYYAGKITAYKGDNKYMVLFEDGASKALSKDVIVIGDKDTLPILGHAVHALTGGDTYETGFVDEVKRNDENEVLYVVRIDDGTVEVTASDMYLSDEQAKWINKACKAADGTTADESMQSPSSSGKRGSATNTPVLLQTPDEAVGTASEKGSRSTRSKRGADKPQTPSTPEAGYSGGVGKKGRRGRRLS